MKKMLALGAVLALSLCAVQGAEAAYDPIGGGTTRIVFDGSFLSLLKKGGVKLLAQAPARIKGGALVMPVSGGKADPTIKKGEIEQEGTLVFQAGNRKVLFRNIEYKQKKTPLFAKVGGSQLKLASAKKVGFAREGFGSGFSASGLELTAKVATRLNKKLRTGKLFAEGESIGTARSKTVPQRVTVIPGQGSATLVPDPAILAKFKALFVSLNPIAPAELSPGPVLHFPIGIGGQISPSAGEGQLRLAGAIELLQLGAGQVFHKEYWLDLGARSTSAEVDIEPTPAFPGKLGRVGVFDTDTGGATASSEPKARSISVAGDVLRLQASTAQSFNSAFAEGKPAFSAGEAFGTLSFGAVGQ
jgi:hypothetical protein